MNSSKEGDASRRICAAHVPALALEHNDLNSQNEAATTHLTMAAKLIYDTQVQALTQELNDLNSRNEAATTYLTMAHLERSLARERQRVQKLREENRCLHRDLRRAGKQNAKFAARLKARRRWRATDSSIARLFLERFRTTQRRFRMKLRRLAHLAQ